MLASNTSSQIHTDWPSSLRNKGVYFVKRDKVSHLCHLCQSLPVFVKSFTIFVIVNQEPIPHLDEGLNNKEMNEELLNYLTCGDVHPNVLGFHCLCSCYPTKKLHSTELLLMSVVSLLSLCAALRALLRVGGGGDCAPLQEREQHLQVPKVSRRRHQKTGA